MTTEEYLLIPSNRIKFEDFKKSFELKYPDIKFSDIEFNVEGAVNLNYIAGKSAAQVNSSELRDLFQNHFKYDKGLLL